MTSISARSAPACIRVSPASHHHPCSRWHHTYSKDKAMEAQRGGRIHPMRTQLARGRAGIPTLRAFRHASEMRHVTYSSEVFRIGRRQAERQARVLVQCSPTTRRLWVLHGHSAHLCVHRRPFRSPRTPREEPGLA